MENLETFARFSLIAIGFWALLNFSDRIFKRLKGKPTKNRVMLFSHQSKIDPFIVQEGHFAEAVLIEGFWFASRIGGSFSEGTACMLNSDGTVTAGSYIKSWARISGMDGFGPHLRDLDEEGPK